jgi:hypothetical protein
MGDGQIPGGCADRSAGLGLLSLPKSDEGWHPSTVPSMCTHCNFARHTRSRPASISYGQGVTAAFIATLVLLVIALAVLGVRERSHRLALRRLGEEASANAERAAEAERVQHEAEATAEREIEATATRTAEMEATRRQEVAAADAVLAEHDAKSAGRIKALEAELAGHDATAAGRIEQLQTQVAGLEAERPQLDAAAAEATARAEVLERELADLQAREAARVTPEPAPDTRPIEQRPPRLADDAGWRLLLARIERQWADVVNAGADERGIVDGSAGAQLAEAVQRDLERLREEVGVETTTRALGPVEYRDPLTILLAVGEAVALLAYHSEHVQVDLRDDAVVVGQDWTGDDDARRRLEQFVTLVTGAGVGASLDVGDGVAQVVLGAGPDAAGS